MNAENISPIAKRIYALESNTRNFRLKSLYNIELDSKVTDQCREALTRPSFYLFDLLQNIKLYNFLGKINNSHLLSALQASFIFTIPIVLIGCIVDFIRGNVLSFITEYLPSRIVIKLSDLSDAIVASTPGFSTILFISAFSYRYVSNKSAIHNFHIISPPSAATVSVLSFLILTSDTGTITLLDKIPISKSLPLATISMITSTGSYCFLSYIALASMRISALSGTLLLDSLIPKPIFAFTGTLILVCIIKYFTLYFNIEDIIFEFNQVIGFDGESNKGSVLQPYNMGLFGGTLGIILAFILFTRTINNRNIIILSFFAAVFFLNEPILMWFHVVFYPILIFPFSLCYLLFNSGLPLEFMELKNNNHFSVILATLDRYIGEMSMSSALHQSQWLFLWFCVYAPFVKLCELTSVYSTVQSIRKLGELSEATENPTVNLNLLQLTTAEGKIARALANDLRKSIKNSQDIYLLFQPQIDMKKLEVMGVEALLRWKHPIYGAIPTPLTIQLAEELYYIKELGEFVLGRACQARHKWTSIVDSEFTMSVNISPTHLLTERFDEIVLATLQHYRLEPKYLELEITETAELALDAASIAAVHRLRADGVRIALDDYGMGHTSLRYLQNLPVDTVKIDRSLTTDVTSTVTTEILRSIKQLGDAMAFNVVIEGVETEAQLIKFTELGFQRFQGYIFSKPLPEALFSTYLERKTEHPPKFGH